MELPVEVKNILEGVYYYLEEVLQNESLRGSGESMRLGLLLQLKNLNKSFPSLSFSLLSETPSSNIYVGSESSAAIPYTGMDFAKKVHNWRTSMSSSSGSSGYNTEWYRTVDENEEAIGADVGTKSYEEKIYEEFETQNEELEKVVSTNNEDSPIVNDTILAAADCTNLLPFRSLITKSSHHDILLKECEAFEPTLKTFHGVLSGRLLHLYNNITDRSPFQVINLSQYTTVRDCHSDGNKQHNQGCKFKFELIGPENKNHTFITYTLQDKNQWMKLIRKAIFFHGLLPRLCVTPNQTSEASDECLKEENENKLFKMGNETSRLFPKGLETTCESKEVKRSHSINCPPEIYRKRYNVNQSRPLPEIPLEGFTSSSYEEGKTDDESDNTYSDIEDDLLESCVKVSNDKPRVIPHEVVRETKSFERNFTPNTSNDLIPTHNPKYGVIQVIQQKKKTDRILNLLNNKTKFFQQIRKNEDKSEAKTLLKIHQAHKHANDSFKTTESDSPRSNLRRNLFKINSRENLFHINNSKENLFHTANSKENLFHTANSKENLFHTANSKENLFHTTNSKENLFRTTNSIEDHLQTGSKENLLHNNFQENLMHTNSKENLTNTNLKENFTTKSIDKLPQIPPLQENFQSSDRTCNDSDSDDKPINLLKESKSLSQEIYDIIGERFASFPDRDVKTCNEDVHPEIEDDNLDHLYDIPRQLHFNLQEQPYQRRFSEADLKLYDTPRPHYNVNYDPHEPFDHEDPSSPPLSLSPPPLPPRPPPILRDTSSEWAESITIIDVIPNGARGTTEDLNHIAFQFSSDKQ